MPKEPEISGLSRCYQRIYALVREIPPGTVMTYGQIAARVVDVADSAVPAVTVGRAMAASARTQPDLPWWRVIGGNGDVGLLRIQAHREEQAALLAREGVIADDEGRYDLRKYRYEPLRT